MFLRRQEVKQHIMLGTDPHVLPQLILLLEHINPEYRCFPLGLLNEPSQHGYSGRLARPIVTQEGEYLSAVHGKGAVVDCNLLTELLSQATDF